MKEIAARCPHCHGSGHAVLSPPLAKTYAVVKKLRRSTKPEIESALGETLSPSAVSKRLARLIESGAVTRIVEKGRVPEFQCVK